MNPISLRTLLQSLLIFHSRGPSELDVLLEDTGVSRRRAKEIIDELVRLGLLQRTESLITCTLLGEKFVNALKNSEWPSLHDILVNKCREYQSVIHVLREAREGIGLTLSEICLRSSNYGISINVVIGEVCIEWGIRLGVIQKNLYTTSFRSRYYYVQNESVALSEFRKILLEQYKHLNFTRSGHNLMYVSIPELREAICEALRLRREIFDRFFEKLYVSESSVIELSGGPLTGTARKAPTKKLSIFIDRKSLIMAPKLALEAQEGFRFRGRVYQMVAFYL